MGRILAARRPWRSDPERSTASTASLLSFTVDTSSGAITAISLQGSTADYMHAARRDGVQHDQDRPSGHVVLFFNNYTDFSVVQTAAVPEPASLGLSALSWAVACSWDADEPQVEIIIFPDVPYRPFESRCHW